MKRFILAAVLAVPILALTQTKAKAQCSDLPAWVRYKVCTCLNCGLHGGHGCGAGGCAGGACGAGGGACGAGGCYRPRGGCGGCCCGHGCGLCSLIVGCNTNVPGPWYLYWPYNGATQEIAGFNSVWPNGWDYEWHWRTPSPWGAPAAAVAYPGPPLAPGVPERP